MRVRERERERKRKITERDVWHKKVGDRMGEREREGGEGKREEWERDRGHGVWGETDRESTDRKVDTM